MGAVQARTITLRAFRGMDSLSGELRVVGGSRRRRGVRRQERQASCKSLEGKTGFGATCEATAGGSAHTSAARAADRETDASLAEPKAEPAGRASKREELSTREGNATRRKPQRGRARKGKSEDAGLKARHYKRKTAKTRKARGKPKKEPKDKPKDKSEDKAKDKKEENVGTKSGGGGGEAIESLWEERACLDGGPELPEDGPGFVDAVNAHIDLVRTVELLLRGRDEKSSKSLVELLLEMKYGEDLRAGVARMRPAIDVAPQAMQE